MSKTGPKDPELVVLAAVRRFNHTSADPEASNANGGAGGSGMQFMLHEIEYVNSSILAIGELRGQATDAGTAHPLVLSWKLDSNGRLRELTAYDSQEEAIAAINPPKAPLRFRSVGFTR